MTRLISLACAAALVAGCTAMPGMSDRSGESAQRTPIEARNAECQRLRVVEQAGTPGPANPNPSQQQISAAQQARAEMNRLGCTFAPDTGPATTG